MPTYSPADLKYWQTSNVIYVGKHGNDAHDGREEPRAKLTIGAAILAAAAESPAANNRWTVEVLDSADYAEAVTTQAYIDLMARRAKLTQPLIIADDSDVAVREVATGAGTIAVSKPLGATATSRFWADRVVVTGNGIGVANIGGGVMMAYIAQVYLETGFGVGDGSTALGHMHIAVGDIYIQGAAGTGLARAGAGTIVGKVDHILEAGAGVGAGVGILVAAGSIDVNVRALVANTAYNVAGGATLNMFANEVTGTPAGAGTANVTTP